MHEKFLIIAPHPDDEVLGCGGIIKKYSSSGNQVFVLIATRGKIELYSDDKIEKVRQEALNAHEILGVNQTFFLDFPAPDLDQVPIADISREINRIIVENNIGILYLPHFGDIHHDHKIIFNAGLVAARPVGNYTVKKIYAYETLSETEWAIPRGDDIFIPTCFENISDVFNWKLEAMKCFKSQLKPFPNSRSLETIESLAKFRGSTVGFTHAEAFSIVREIRG